jgi:hypothetical protein
MSRRLPRGASRVLGALLIAPRDFLTTFCERCRRTLYYTYAGEPCPFCETLVERVFEGRIPIPDDRPGVEGAAEISAARRGRARRPGRSAA